MNVYETMYILGVVPDHHFFDFLSQNISSHFAFIVSFDIVLQYENGF